MSDVNFDNDKYGAIARSQVSNYGARDESGITCWLIRSGIIKNRKTAVLVLLTFSLACLVLASWIAFGRKQELVSVPPGVKYIKSPGGLPRPEVLISPRQ